MSCTDTRPMTTALAAGGKVNPVLAQMASDLAQAQTAYEDAAGAEGDRLHALMRELRKSIIGTPARSMADVRLKTRIVVEAYGADDTEIEQEMREEIGDNTSVNSLALMIVLDLSRLSHGVPQ